MAYRARFNQRSKFPTLHHDSCAEAQFANGKPRQTSGLHESGDVVHHLDVVTSAKAYQVLEAEFPGKVKICGCAEGSTLKAILGRSVGRP